VHFPAGEWLPFEADGAAAVQGPQFLSVAAPLERMPLYVRAGAVLPMSSEAATTAQIDRSVLELHLYLPESDGRTSSRLRLDDGLSLEYSGQLYEFDLVRSRASLRLETRISGTAGGWTPKLWRLVLHRSGRATSTRELAQLPASLPLDCAGDL
jgi:alpha-glucosidase (family GH31 glycosyl hydrolase)